MKKMVNISSLSSGLLFIALLAFSLVSAVEAREKGQFVIFESGFIHPPDDTFNHTHGPFDVAEFSEVRVIVVNDSASPTVGVNVRPASVLPSGAEIELNQFSITDNSGESATELYILPGPTMKVIVESSTGNDVGFYNIAIIGGN